ncbi:hypothetical protein FBU30_001863 [Linnemannia zychae]|nr:hypothetical protein FBU30_001863 [Linnemannia zychae]
MGAHIRAYLPKLNSLDLKDTMLRKAVAPLLSACVGGLKNIRTQAALDRMSCEALVKHCDTLEVLEVMTILAFSSKTLRRVLFSSPRLKALITLDDKPDVSKFLDGRQRYDVLTETYAGEGRHLQRRVHDRLARLTNLEELCLGHETRSNIFPESFFDGGESEDYQYECLEMTLESGLDQLKDLKNLRVLDVQRMEQRIGLEQVRWMTSHWPRLREIRGLCNDGNNLEAAEWLWKHFPMIKVKVSSRCFYCATILDGILKEQVYSGMTPEP